MKLNVSQQMKDILTDYSDEIMKKVTEIINEVGEEAADELHSAGSFQGNKYRKSWKVKQEEKRTFNSAIVYNAKHASLTHLLEFGHAKVNGGRTRAFPHIAPANEKATREAERRIIKMIEGIR